MHLFCISAPSFLVRNIIVNDVDLKGIHYRQRHLVCLFGRTGAERSDYMYGHFRQRRLGNDNIGQDTKDCVETDDIDVVESMLPDSIRKAERAERILSENEIPACNKSLYLIDQFPAVRPFYGVYDGQIPPLLGFQVVLPVGRENLFSWEVPDELGDFGMSAWARAVPRTPETKSF